MTGHRKPGPKPDVCRVLARYVRRLSDDDLNDLLLELVPERFGALLDAALGDHAPQATTRAQQAAGQRGGEAA